MKIDEQVLIKNEDGPIFALMDFFKNPVFLLSREKPSGFDGNFLVSGEVKTIVSGASLLEDENDLFAATVHLYKKKYNFAVQTLDFTGQEILELMKWGTSGKSYQRLRKAAINLLSARVMIRDIFADGRSGEGGSTLISDYYIFDQAKSSSRNLNRITLSPLVMEKCRSGQLKAVHPIYFNLRRAQEKRLFALISVRASDLVQWDAPLFGLRDLMPLQGKTYEKFGQLKAKIEIILNGLKEKTVIRKYEFIKRNFLSDSFFAIYPNHEYFFSRQERGVVSTYEKSNEKHLNEPELFKTLVDFGVTQSVVSELIVDQKMILEAKKQLEHFEFLVSKGKKPRDPPGWLIQAIKNQYAPPKDLEIKEVRSRKLVQRSLLKSAETYLSSGHFEKALSVADECLALGTLPAATRIKTEAEKVLNRKKIINQAKEGFSEEILDSLKEQAWERTAKLLKCNIDKVKQHAFGEPIWQETFNELVLQKACSVENDTVP